jgi:transposase
MCGTETAGKEFLMKVAKEVQRKWSRFRDKRRKIIRSMAKGHPDAQTRTRAQIIIGLVQSKAVHDIADILQCSASLVYKVANCFLKQGEVAFADRREHNGQTVVTKGVQKLVWAMVAETPRQFGHRRPTWTLELMVRVLKQRTGLAVSRATLSRVLRRLKIRRGRPKPFVKCPWPEERRDRRIRRLRYLLLHARPGEVWVFEDEVDIHLNPKIGPDYMLPGTQKKVLTPGVNEKRYLAGASNAFTGQLTWVEGESKDSELFIRLIYQLGWDYPEAKRIHLILDNYGIHKSRFTKLVLASCDGMVRLHFLPPYCPDDNRIERVWLDLHANVTRNHQCPIMNELMKEARYWLRKESKRLQKKYAQRDRNDMYAIAS